MLETAEKCPDGVAKVEAWGDSSGPTALVREIVYVVALSWTALERPAGNRRWVVQTHRRSLSKRPFSIADSTHR